MNRQAQGVVMLLLGGAILKASLSDLYLRYVKAGLQPYLIGAGALLVIAAVMTIWYDLKHGSAVDTECADGDESHDGHEHEHSHKEPRVGWLLIAPVLGLLLVAPPALGAYAASKSGTAIQAQSDYPPLPEGDPAQLSVLDYATRAVFDKGRGMEERKVEVSGFLSKNDGGQVLTRIVLSCCAADGRPVKVGMIGNTPNGLPDDAWVEVVGKYTDKVGKDSINDSEIPFIEVLEWHPIDAPRNPYE